MEIKEELKRVIERLDNVSLKELRDEEVVDNLIKLRVVVSDIFGMIKIDAFSINQREIKYKQNKNY